MIPFFFILFSSFRRLCLLTKRQIKSFALRRNNNLTGTSTSLIQNSMGFFEVVGLVLVDFKYLFLHLADVEHFVNFAIIFFLFILLIFFILFFLFCILDLQYYLTRLFKYDFFKTLTIAALEERLYIILQQVVVKRKLRVIFKTYLKYQFVISFLSFFLLFILAYIKVRFNITLFPTIFASPGLGDKLTQLDSNIGYQAPGFILLYMFIYFQYLSHKRSLNCVYSYCYSLTKKYINYEVLSNGIFFMNDLLKKLFYGRSAIVGGGSLAKYNHELEVKRLALEKKHQEDLEIARQKFEAEQLRQQQAFDAQRDLTNQEYAKQLAELNHKYAVSQMDYQKKIDDSKNSASDSGDAAAGGD